jgi:hypothetical protein
MPWAWNFGEIGASSTVTAERGLYFALLAPVLAELVMIASLAVGSRPKPAEPGPELHDGVLDLTVTPGH